MPFAEPEVSFRNYYSIAIACTVLESRLVDLDLVLDDLVLDLVLNSLTVNPQAQLDCHIVCRLTSNTYNLDG